MAFSLPKALKRKSKGKSVWFDKPQGNSTDNVVTGEKVSDFETIVTTELEIEKVSSFQVSTSKEKRKVDEKSKKDIQKTYEDPNIRENKRWDRWEAFSAISKMSIEELVAKADAGQLVLDSRGLSRLQKRFYSMTKGMKRAHYACGDKYVITEEIASLNKMYTELEAKGENTKGSLEMNEKISLWYGDITTLEVDAIVDSCASSIVHSIIYEKENGVTQAILKAASRLLLYEFQSFRKDVIYVGEVFVTAGYLLPAKFIFHTSGPGSESGIHRLKECYVNCLQKMVDMSLRTIAFPCISTGLKMIPPVDAAWWALETVRDWLRDHLNYVDKIIFCIYDQSNWKAYNNIVQTVFPPCAQPTMSIDSLLPAEILRMDKRSIELYKKALAEGKESSYNIRVMVVGHFGVGKTTLTKRLFGEDVDIGKRESTNGIQVHVHRCKVELDTGKWVVSDKGGSKETVYHRLAKLLRQIHLDDEPETMATVAKDNEQSKEQEQTELKVVDDHYREGLDDVDGANFSESSIQTVPDRQSNSESCSDVPEGAIDKTKVPDDALFTDLYELVKEIKESPAEDSGSSSADLSIWDFAGQYAFYATHQVFLSRRAIYLLVTDISKLADDIVQDDDCYLDSKGGKQCKISEYVNFWLNSIHEFCSSDDTPGPPVILVGTFVDKLSQDNRQVAVDNFFYNLRCSLVDKVITCHLIEENFALDNTKASEELDALKTKLLETAARQDYWGEVIPAKWITLEKVLLNLRSEGLKLIRKSKVLELNSTLPVPVETEEELELFLNFHHEYGDLIYYSHDDRLSETVVLDPQWLVDAFKCLLTAKMFCCKNHDVLKQWMKFDSSAVISVQLIETIWKQEPKFRDHTELLLEYLEKLGLLAKPCQLHDQGVQADDYFAPSVLKDTPPVDVLKCTDNNVVSTSKLCLTTPSQFLPTAVFNKLLAACLAKFPLCRHKAKRMIFCGCGVFELEKNHRMYVYFYDNVIQIWVIRYSSDKQEPDTELCLKVRDFVLGVVVQHVNKVILYIRCPKADSNSNSDMLLVDEVLKQKEVLCSCQGSPHVAKTEDILRCWLVKDNVSDSGSPSDKDLGRIAHHIGKEYNALGIELGLSQAEIDHINIEYRTVVDRTTAILIRWRDCKTKKGTFEELRNAMIFVGSDVNTAFASV